MTHLICVKAKAEKNDYASRTSLLYRVYLEVAGEHLTHEVAIAYWVRDYKINANE